MSENTHDLNNELDIIYEPVKLANNTINLAFEYHRSKKQLDELFVKYSPARAIAFYNQTIVPQFIGLQDKPYRDRIIEINEDNTLDMEESFMLHFAELVLLLTRAGLMPRHDVVVHAYSDDAPHSVSELYPDNNDSF